MDEKLLHYIWNHKLFDINDSYTTDGEKLQILSVGLPNQNSGPDFSEAKIKWNNILWVGCVEIHVKASDWNKHHHQKNDEYNNVILHVVYEYDKDVYASNDCKIPTLELKPLIPQRIIKMYQSFMQSADYIACGKQFAQVDSFRLYAWLDRLLMDRLEEKAAYVTQLLHSCNQNQEEAFYVFLSYYFGFNINNFPFRLLAKSTPLNYLAKHKNNLFQLEAMLFGQADLLSSGFQDEYSKSLQDEYIFLKNKLSLHPICTNEMWKFAKTYPSGFPTQRLAQLAALINQSSALLSKIIEAESVKVIQSYFQVKISSYWENHYLFGVPTQRKQKGLGKTAINTLIINAILPYMYQLGNVKQNQILKDKAIAFYEELPFEKHKITKVFSSLRNDFTNAFHSQALIQLKKKYCNTKRCLHCGIGLHLLQNT
ncbi:MAG: DUF2851 family protein [Bacteroidales bacterium]|jgi:hypothetical protein|nr:DUF2851 family protein [Bacteroidales bacterium]MDD2687147.1 DUF2851 family protein [Bacteroidales bacterium]MDD3330067.1 DUF2851 family protein [Bacteroidales bacterium]MDD3691977.1 DUF2851 family protein [Bacteroidales bacterium]MDD4044085.1 DUF2851 family protein [Bacteroidales bacterium]